MGRGCFRERKHGSTPSRQSLRRLVLLSTCPQRVWTTTGCPQRPGPTPPGPPRTRVLRRRLRLSLSLSRRRAMLSSPRVFPFWLPFFCLYYPLSPGRGSALTAAFLLVMPFDLPSNYTYTAYVPSCPRVFRSFHSLVGKRTSAFRRCTSCVGQGRKGKEKTRLILRLHSAQRSKLEERCKYHFNVSDRKILCVRGVIAYKA